MHYDKEKNNKIFDCIHCINYRYLSDLVSGLIQNFINKETISGKPDFSQYYKGNYREAFDKLLPAAEKGDAIAQLSLGNLYSRGLGVKQDYKKAYYWYKLAAEQGNTNAVGSIGTMYQFGIYFKKNDGKAIEYYNKVLNSDSSNTTTKYNLALIYLN